MIDFFFALIAAALNSGAERSESGAVVLAAPAPAVVEAPAVAPTPSVALGDNVSVGTGSVIIGGGLLDGTSDSVQPVAPAVAPAPALPEFNMAVVPAGLVAEPQTPSGKFTTAAEVKPILNATKGNWVAVREYGGKDLLYVSHLWGWRCGLAAMAISVNGEPMQNWPLPACHMKDATPNAMLEEDGLPYLSLRLGAVQTIDIQIVYDDLSMDRASFERGNVLIP